MDAVEQFLRQLCVLICTADDLTLAPLTELAAFEFPLPDLAARRIATARDDLAATVLTTGHAIPHR